MLSINDFLMSAGSATMQLLEPRRMLAGDLAVADVSCDSKFNWLVPGDRFNVIVELENASYDNAAVGKVDVTVYARGESGELSWVGEKLSVPVNLGPVTFRPGGDDDWYEPVTRKTKVTVPIDLGAGYYYESGLNTFMVYVDPAKLFDRDGEVIRELYEDESDDNNSMSTTQSSRQSEYVWDLVDRVGTYDAGDLFPDDPRISLRKNVKINQIVYEDLYDQYGEPVDLDQDGITDDVAKRVTATLTGNGYVEFNWSEEVGVWFSGTDSTSAFAMTVSGGKAGYPGMNRWSGEDIRLLVNGSIKSIKMPAYDFTNCQFDIEGSIGEFVVGEFDSCVMNVGYGAGGNLGTFSALSMSESEVNVQVVPGTFVGAKINVKGVVANSDIESTGVIAGVSVGSWNGGRLEAYTFGTIDSKGDFSGDIVSNGVNRSIIDSLNGDPTIDLSPPRLVPVALSKLSVRARAAGNWDLDGTVGSLSIGSVYSSGEDAESESLFISIAGRLDRFTCTGNVWGDFSDWDGDGFSDDTFGLYAFSMNTVTFNGNVRNSNVSAGYAYSGGILPWFPDAAAESNQKIGFIGSVTVKGDLESTFFDASLHPSDGLRRDDFQLSEIRKITLGGSLKGYTEFMAYVMQPIVKAKVYGFGAAVQTIRTNPSLYADYKPFEYNEDGYSWFKTRMNL